ncbi:MAG: hypothetical protein ACE5IA_07730 [Dehalococcoidia bacterium]
MVHGSKGSYDRKGLQRQIATIEKAAREMKGISGGILAIDKNADAILVLTNLLRNGIPDIAEMEP